MKERKFDDAVNLLKEVYNIDKDNKTADYLMTTLEAMRKKEEGRN